MEAAEGPVKVIPHREHLGVEGVAGVVEVVMLHKLPSVTRYVTRHVT